MRRLSLISCAVIAACDAASGPHLILIALLIIGPVCATGTQYMFLTAVGTTATVAATVRQRQHP